MKNKKTKPNQTKLGRKTKLTKQTTERFIEAIEIGCTHSLACQYAGITPATFYGWMKQGKEKQSKNKIDFFNTIKRAEANGAISNLQLIKKAGLDDWRASAWIMERRHNYIKTNQIKMEEQEPEAEQAKTTQELLQQQQLELLKASKQALNIGSFQAYAALQRQVLSVTLQLQALEGDANELQDQTDEELIETITNIVKTLPPVLQQRIKEDITDTAPKTVKIHD